MGEMWIRLQPGSSKSSIALDCLPLKFFFGYFPPSLLPFGGIVIMIQRNLVHLLNVAIREYRSLQASSPIWASEANLARPVSIAQTGELARRL